MNKTADLLQTFGFVASDAQAIAEKARENGLTLADVQAWIDEATASTSLHNPLGFVRARIQTGNKVIRRPTGDPHQIHRQRYKTQWERSGTRPWPYPKHAAQTSENQFPHIQFQPSYRGQDTIQTCKCGRVEYKTRFCAECKLCPTCCKCEAIDPDKE